MHTHTQTVAATACDLRAKLGFKNDAQFPLPHPLPHTQTDTHTDESTEHLRLALFGPVHTRFHSIPFYANLSYARVSVHYTYFSTCNYDIFSRTKTKGS